MEKIILKTDEVIKSGNEVFAESMKNIITKDNVVPLALVGALVTVFIVHDFFKHGCGIDIETETVKISLRPKHYYSQAV